VTRANLSDPLDTLADMTKSKSHQTGEPSIDDTVDGAGTYANRSLAPDRLRSTLDFDSDADVRLLPDVTSPDAAAPWDETTPVNRRAGERAGRPARQLLPDDLEQTAPGPALLEALSKVDLMRLNGHDVVRYMQSAARIEAHYAAMRLAAVAEVTLWPGGSPDDDASRMVHDKCFASSEVAAALSLTERAADNMVSHAVSLAERVPAVRDALHAGLIDSRRAQVMGDETINVKADTARALIDEIMADAPDLTTGQLRRRLQRSCLVVCRTNSEAVSPRLVRHLGDRRPLRRPAAPDQAGRAYDRINRLARALKEEGDGRRLDQLRADVYLDLLTGDIATRRQGTVDLVVDLTTLTGLDDHPGELAGYGPVTADIARKVAAESEEAEWRHTVTVDGEPAHVGTTSRRPTASMQRLVQAIHRTCVFPGWAHAVHPMRPRPPGRRLRRRRHRAPQPHSALQAPPPSQTRSRPALQGPPSNGSAQPATPTRPEADPRPELGRTSPARPSPNPTAPG